MKSLITLVLVWYSLVAYAQQDPVKAKRDSLEKRLATLEDSLNEMDDEIMRLESELYSLDTIGYSKTWRSRHTGDFSSFDLRYFNKFYDHRFYDQLSSIHMISPGKEQHWVGIQYAGFITTSREFSGPGCLNASQLLPFNVVINDSVKAKMTAFNIGLSFFGTDLLRKNNHFELYVMLGANAGRTWIYGDDRVQSKNPFFAPKLTVMPRIAFWHLVLSCSAEYDWDISSTRWKPMIWGPKSTQYIQPFRQSGLSLAVSLGCYFE